MAEEKTYTLLQLRSGKRWTQKEAADKLDVSVSTLSNWENEKKFPTIDKVWEIEEVYGVPMSVINFSPSSTVYTTQNLFFKKIREEK